MYLYIRYLSNKVRSWPQFRPCIDTLLTKRFAPQIRLTVRRGRYRCCTSCARSLPRSAWVSDQYHGLWLPNWCRPRTAVLCSPWSRRSLGRCHSLSQRRSRASSRPDRLFFGPRLPWSPPPGQSSSPCTSQKPSTRAASRPVTT